MKDYDTVSPYDLLSERERRVLDMWPRFEDGERVMIGDSYKSKYGYEIKVAAAEFFEDIFTLNSESGDNEPYGYGERVKRPDVLAADGKPLHEGETVYLFGKPLPMRVIDARHAPLPGGDPAHTVEVEPEGYEETHLYCTPDSLTHESPDSWERWRGEFILPPKQYCKEVLGIAFDSGEKSYEKLGEAFDLQVKDMERRAKALCGAEYE